MILGNIFSDAQISALKSIATAQTDAEKYTSHMSDKAWEMLYDLAAELGQKLTPKFWQNLDAKVHTDQEVVVCMRGKKDLCVETVTRNACFARHLGMMLKNSYSIVWFGKEKAATMVTWDNWKSVYNALTQQESTQEYDTPMSKAQYFAIKTARRKEKEFYDLARPIRTKKSGRCRISFEEANAQRIKADKIDFECRVEARARRIFAAL